MHFDLCVPELCGSMIIAEAFMRCVRSPSRCFPFPSTSSHSNPCIRLAISGTYMTSRQPAKKKSTSACCKALGCQASSEEVSLSMKCVKVNTGWEETGESAHCLN